MNGVPKISLLPKRFLDWCFVLFVSLTIIFSTVRGQTYIYLYFGYAFTILFSFYALHNNIKPVPEVGVYWAWLLWATLAGVFTALDQALYKEMLWTCIQIGIMIFLVTAFQKTKSDMGLFFFATIVAISIIVFISFQNGEINLARREEMLMGPRIEGMTGNANTFGYYFLCAAFGLTYIIVTKKKLLTRFVCIGLVGACFFGAIFTASKKAFIGFIAFYAFLWLFSLRREFFKKPIIILLTTVITATVLIGSLFFLEGTRIGKRFEDMQTGEVSAETRKSFYEVGLEIVERYPIAGVGLGNFKAYPTAYGMYSHSNYVEVITNTGVVGFFLYYMIYFILFLRLRRISRLTADPHTLTIIGLMTAIFFTQILYGFAMVQIASKMSWLVLCVLIGHSSYLNKTLTKQRFNILKDHNSLAT